MYGADINYRQSLEELRDLVQATGEPTLNIDQLLEHMDKPQWAASLDERLYEKIVSVTATVHKRMKEKSLRLKKELSAELDQLNLLIGEE